MMTILLMVTLIFATSSFSSLAIPNNLDQLQKESLPTIDSTSSIPSANGSVKIDLVPPRRASSNSDHRKGRCGRKKRCKKDETCQRTCRSKCVKRPNKEEAEVNPPTMDPDCYKIVKHFDGKFHDHKLANERNGRTKGIGATCTRDRECCLVSESEDHESPRTQCCSNGCRHVIPHNETAVKCDKNIDPCQLVTANGVDLGQMNGHDSRYLAPADVCNPKEDSHACCYAAHSNAEGFIKYICQENTCRPLTPI